MKRCCGGTRHICAEKGCQVPTVGRQPAVTAPTNAELRGLLRQCHDYICGKQRALDLKMIRDAAEGKQMADYDDSAPKIHEQLAAIGKGRTAAEAAAEIKRLKEWQRIANQRAVEVADLKRELKDSLARIEQIQELVGHFAAAPSHPDMPLLSILGDVARMLRAVEKGT